jgi:hypothetical protein
MEDAPESGPTATSGKQETDSALTIVKMRDRNAIDTINGMKDPYVLREVIRLSQNKSVVDAARERLDALSQPQETVTRHRGGKR